MAAFPSANAQGVDSPAEPVTVCHDAIHTPCREVGRFCLGRSMTKRKWVKGRNGLWSSYDPVIRRQVERRKAKEAREAEQAKRAA